MSRILVTGAGGFIGHHLIKRLKAEGHFVRGVDLKAPEYENSSADEFLFADLRYAENAFEACENIDRVFHLAAEMGGIGATLPHDYGLRLGNARIDQNTIEGAMRSGVQHFFYASTACVYNELLQGENAAPLKEEDAYPAQPDLAYGWVKLMGEQLLLDAALESQMSPSIARFHNVFGSLGAWRGGLEKSPAALCRKVAVAKLTDAKSIDVWGTGKQIRSYMFVDDCVEGILRLVESGYAQPLNLGRSEAISIDDLARLIMKIAGVELDIVHDLTKPVGVNTRNSDNGRLQQALGWQPQIPLETGLRSSYEWIETQAMQWLNEGEKVV